MPSDRPHVALIGPVTPFRGGIAQHTALLLKELSARGDVEAFSFSRQYPCWFFPGESDRDPTLVGQVEPGVRYMIDSMNPLTWRRTLRAIIGSGARSVIIPWWTVFWAPCFGYLARAFHRAGIEVVFLCHNVVEHEPTVWKIALTRMVLRSADRFVVHTHSDASLLEDLLPGAKVAVCPHPVYESFPSPSCTLPRRSATELLFFGFIRPYKGLPVLLDAMHLLGDLDVALSIVGEPWCDITPLVTSVRDKGLADRIEFVTRYVSAGEAADFFARADLVVLPYLSATGSGVVPLAYHYRKPVIVTTVGGLPDVVEDGVSGYLIPPDDPAAAASAVRRFVSEQPRDMTPGIALVSSTMTWSRLAAVVLSGSD
ncbi:MAG: glycosyltransferase [Coriobacteriia bacterium]|nr:glycosyltransferase [Coriobacteriia bacterium]